MSVTERDKAYSPLVFVNNPVSDSAQDVIGFDVQVQTLQESIDSGATMIGLIADYGCIVMVTVIPNMQNLSNLLFQEK